MRLKIAIAAALIAAASTTAAQEWWERGWGGFRRFRPRMATEASFDGGFNFCRGMYTSGWREPGGQGWRTDYPDADINFSIRLSELTKTRVSRVPSGEPNHLVVRLTDEALFQCPFVLMSDVGTAALSDPEVVGLRAYLLKGGFLWVDDFWGDHAWEVWRSEIARALPPAEFPITDVTPDHPIFRTLFEVKAVPQIPSIQSWSRNGGQTSERGAETAQPHMRAISDRHGRIMVLMTHNTDISDAWEREGEDPRYFYSFSPNGYAVGINAVIYALTH